MGRISGSAPRVSLKTSQRKAKPLSNDRSEDNLVEGDIADDEKRSIFLGPKKSVQDDDSRKRNSFLGGGGSNVEPKQQEKSTGT
jgi:hypothetical protein